ncbi:MAG: hypothetical protein QXP60_01120 [Nitrososphaerota archaeon]
MSHIDEVKILRKRAKSFLLRAIECLNSKDYDLASFSFGASCTTTS